MEEPALWRAGSLGGKPEIVLADPQQLVFLSDPRVGFSLRCTTQPQHPSLNACVRSVSCSNSTESERKVSEKIPETAASPLRTNAPRCKLARHPTGPTAPVSQRRRLCVTRLSTQRQRPFRNLQVSVNSRTTLNFFASSVTPLSTETPLTVSVPGLAVVTRIR